MAKKTDTAPKQQINPVLPLPERVIRHHLATLERPMREWKSSGRIPPVLLLSGISGIGKRSMAHYLSQWIFCERNGFAKPAPGDDDQGAMDLFGGGALETPVPVEASAAGEALIEPCGECPACLRALHGTWVDFTEVRPESDGETESRTLKADQFRQIKSQLGFGAHEGAYRVVLIPDADRMTPQAANSMLKLLEEPPPGWIFLLTAGDPALILPTVLSRCQQMRFRPFNLDEIRALVADAGVPAARAELCAQLAQGSWGRALKLAEPEMWEQRPQVLKLFQDPSAAINPLIDWAASAPESFDLLLNQLESLLAELVQWSLKPEASEAKAWQNSDAKAALLAYAKLRVPQPTSAPAARMRWLDSLDRLAQVRRRAPAPLNRKILLQDLLLPFLA